MIPRCSDLASDVLTHSYDDMFNPPGLTNFLGVAQVDHDVFAVRSVSFPPYSHGDTVTGQLYVDGRLLRSHGGQVEVVWRPDRVLRSTRVGDLELRTVTACAPGRPVVVVDLEVAGTPGREVRLGLALASTATRSTTAWLRPEPPSEPNLLSPLPGRPVLAGTGSATSVQGLDTADATVGPGRTMEVTLTLDANGRARLGYVHALGQSLDEALEHFDACTGDVPAVPAAATETWDAALADAFDAEGNGFSGSLPVLETSDDALRKLYWWGVLGVVWFRRDNPASVLGRTYDTLMPRYWQTTTFIWDYSLSSLTHALLDPEPMRRHIEHWIELDTHAHFGTEWLTGGPVGYWYSVNDFAMTRLVRDYVRFTGDHAFLTTELADHLYDWATAWRGLRKNHPLADYGGIDNLLECVSGYVHEVAGLNAANVWCLRVAAEIAERSGDAGGAEALRKEATELAGHVNELYVEGAGFWHARQPDGTLVPIRHCYDFTTVGTTMAADLTDRQRSEMVDFFRRELRTPTWMRALSAYDPDAAYSLRPDHQWNGAYPAWPADAARALFALGHADVALDWLPGLARSANQGPCGQAHFVEAEGEQGARKAPPQHPYLIDWACSSSGSWVSLVLEGVFGLDVALDGTVTATPTLARLDPAARLRGLRVAGRTYDVTADGATALRPPNT